MSGGAIFQESLRRVMALQLPDEARRDVVAALHAAGLPPLMQFLYEAGHEVGLSAETLRARATAAFLFFAAGNLADDLVDGDVDYLDPPVRLGPTVQFLLQHLA